ncbi:MAG: tyrosine--tRNA ligase [Candidatus Microthrix parvicella]|jgi:tyrosyl-tRNA synthetase|uniref:tyrosine--tRNA ligase n=1 Tax=Candidatus Neomicrothrix sp. TaxID=2719034 RepID=UPI000E99B337|nr:tyrosine--tRNA ligase [Candidatus Microthrix sp.]MBK6503045.1 tyrosine--tRNA ligase [Candidatus Microthrix sp.]MBK7321759.1 tyrosine--tRNA ligase [Candidatus Microthrix sp.]MBP7986386.1 tyrosine--tRNA ligase [Candidatus Microthrix sp.]HBX10946.1 tyrosine--tRNA ligase [Candidatus Microthrix parvicella]
MATDAPDITPDEDGPGDAVGWSPETARGGEEASLLDDLAARGLISDSTDLDALAHRLAEGPITLYCGFDPTASSLHAGNLQQLMLLARFARAGHRPLVLVGGATGRIGDPSGRDNERPLLDEATLAANVAAIRDQVGRFVDVVSEGALVDNHDWTGPLTLLDFLRDVGKHVNIGAMLARDSVRSRIDRDAGMSFTEFSYQLLQAHDFVQLHRSHNCELQVAGSDQWGNITAGIDLARRMDGAALHGLTSPLIVRADGKKFGKSTGGAIWLAADETSPYAFYQYWMQIPDDDVESMLLRLTFLSVLDISAIITVHRKEPHRRQGQRALAHHLTAIVHGDDAARSAATASEVIFGGRPAGLDRPSLEMLANEVGFTGVGDEELQNGLDPAELFVRSGLARSKGEVRKNAHGFRVNGSPVDLDRSIGADDLLAGYAAMLSHGKRKHHLLVHADSVVG